MSLDFIGINALIKVSEAKTKHLERLYKTLEEIHKKVEECRSCDWKETFMEIQKICEETLDRR